MEGWDHLALRPYSLIAVLLGRPARTSRRSLRTATDQDCAARHCWTIMRQRWPRPPRVGCLRRRLYTRACNANARSRTREPDWSVRSSKDSQSLLDDDWNAHNPDAPRTSMTLSPSPGGVSTSLRPPVRVGQATFTGSMARASFGPRPGAQ